MAFAAPLSAFAVRPSRPPCLRTWRMGRRRASEAGISHSGTDGPDSTRNQRENEVCAAAVSVPLPINVHSKLQNPQKRKRGGARRPFSSALLEPTFGLDTHNLSFVVFSSSAPTRSVTININNSHNCTLTFHILHSMSTSTLKTSNLQLPCIFYQFMEPLLHRKAVPMYITVNGDRLLIRRLMQLNVDQAG